MKIIKKMLISHMHKKGKLSTQLKTSRSKPTARVSGSSPVYSSTPHDSPTRIPLQQEVAELRRTLAYALGEISGIKKKHESDTKTLQTSYEELKKELETLKFEKYERQAKQAYGLEEYSQLTLELISLRTEVDRLSNYYNREKRYNSMRIMEDKIQKEAL